MERNKGLAATYLQVLTKTQALREDVQEDTSMKSQLDEAKEDTEIARSRWRIMKSVVSAVIAGSGVDWAKNELLRDLVLDNEQEMD